MVGNIKNILYDFQSFFLSGKTDLHFSSTLSLSRVLWAALANGSDESIQEPLHIFPVLFRI